MCNLLYSTKYDHYQLFSLKSVRKSSETIGNCHTWSSKEEVCFSLVLHLTDLVPFLEWIRSRSEGMKKHVIVNAPDTRKMWQALKLISFWESQLRSTNDLSISDGNISLTIEHTAKESSNYVKYIPPTKNSTKNKFEKLRIPAFCSLTT